MLKIIDYLKGYVFFNINFLNLFHSQYGKKIFIYLFIFQERDIMYQGNIFDKIASHYRSFRRLRTLFLFYAFVLLLYYKRLGYFSRQCAIAINYIMWKVEQKLCIDDRIIGFEQYGVYVCVFVNVLTNNINYRLICDAI